jgi:AraC family transcriptional regulator, arabinose operon regulatory protein
LIEYENTECLQTWEVPNITWPYHRLYYVYSGEVSYESYEERFALEKNHFYIFPIYKKYKMTCNPVAPLHCLWFHVNLNHTLLNSTVKLIVEKNTTQFHLIKALEALIADKADLSVIESALNTLLLFILHEEHLVFVSDQRMDKILQHIHDNYKSNPTNTDLANLLNLNSRYFIRLFKKNYGQSPQEYISFYKAFQASKLLLQGMQIKEVAKKIGYEDSKAFSRFFKTHKGISPSEYKNSYYLQP